MTPDIKKQIETESLRADCPDCFTSGAEAGFRLGVEAAAKVVSENKLKIGYDSLTEALINGRILALTDTGGK